MQEITSNFSLSNVGGGMDAIGPQPHVPSVGTIIGTGSNPSNSTDAVGTSDQSAPTGTLPGGFSGPYAPGQGLIVGHVPNPIAGPIQAPLQQ